MLTVNTWVGSLVSLTSSGKEISQLFAVSEDNLMQNSGPGLCQT